MLSLKKLKTIPLRNATSLQHLLLQHLKVTLTNSVTTAFIDRPKIIEEAEFFFCDICVCTLFV